MKKITLIIILLVSFLFIIPAKAETIQEARENFAVVLNQITYLLQERIKELSSKIIELEAKIAKLESNQNQCFIGGSPTIPLSSNYNELQANFLEVTQYQKDNCENDRHMGLRTYYLRSWNIDIDTEKGKRLSESYPTNSQIENQYSDCIFSNNTKYKTPAQMKAYQELKELEAKQ